MFLVANPDVPSVRNAQRLLERVRQLGACGDRVRILLNRAAEPYPIPPKQIETAVGPSDSSHLSERLQDRVDGAQLGRAAGAERRLGDRDAVRSVHAADSRSLRRHDAGRGVHPRAVCSASGGLPASGDVT